MSRRKQGRKEQSRLREQSTVSPAHEPADECQAKVGYFRHFLDYIALLFAVFSIVLWFPAYLPNIHIDHRGPTRPDKPFQVEFSATNNGYFRVSTVSFACEFLSVDTAHKAHIENIKLELTGSIPVLARGDSADFICPFDKAFAAASTNIGDFIAKARFNIVVKFATAVLGIHTFKCANFSGTADDNGQINWLERPIDSSQCNTVVTTITVNAEEVE